MSSSGPAPVPAPAPAPEPAAAAAPPKPRVVVLLSGPQGSGKTTHARRLANRGGLAGIELGDVVREAIAKQTPAGLIAMSILTQSGSSLGSVSDDVLMSIIADRIDQPDCSKGFILVGFPGTMKQVEMLDNFLAKTDEKVNKVITLTAADSILEKRILGRWIHPASGRSYHEKFKPPRSKGYKATEENMKDDSTGEALFQTCHNTSVEEVAELLKRDRDQTEPILAHYKDCLRKVNANQSIHSVWMELQCALPGSPGPGFDDYLTLCFSGLGSITGGLC